MSVSFQRKTSREEITRPRCLSLINSACVGSVIVTALKSSTPCHFGFDCFRKLRFLIGRRMVPRHVVGVPSTEMEFSLHGDSHRLTRSRMFRVPCFPQRGSFVSPPLPSGGSAFFVLWSASIIVRVRHVASSFCSQPKVLPRSCSCRVTLQLEYRLQQLHSSGEDQMNLPRRSEEAHRVHWSRTVLVLTHAIPSSTLGPKMRPDGVSGDRCSLLEVEPCDHWIPSPCQRRLKSRPRPRAPRGSLT